MNETVNPAAGRHESGIAAGQGTANMQAIAQAVQEGASAFLTRQFRTLGVFAAIAFVLWLATERLPIGRYIYAIGANERAAALNGSRSVAMAPAGASMTTRWVSPGNWWRQL